MRYFRENWYLFVIIYVVLVLFDYYKYGAFQWGENVGHLAFFMFFFWLFDWASTKKGR
jgi:hypothetical protein